MEESSCRGLCRGGSPGFAPVVREEEYPGRGAQSRPGGAGAHCGPKPRECWLERRPARDHDQRNVQCLSSDPNIATIDAQGQVTARQTGQTKITGRYGDLMSPAWTLTVRADKPVIKTAAIEVAALTVSAGSREVRIQERLPLRVKAKYTDGNEKGLSSGVEWRLSDASIASIDSRGELLGLRPGKIAVVARWSGVEST